MKPNKKSAAARFIDRELSWLEFNQRVLDEAIDESTPLLERLKFFCIVTSNLDEFFEVRVAGLKQQIESEVVERSLGGLTASEAFYAIRDRVSRMMNDQYRCWREQLLPQLTKSGFRLHNVDELAEDDRAWAVHYYATQVRPVLTPLAIDPAHPFPQLLNKSLNLIIKLEREKAPGERTGHLAIVQIPRIIPRLVRMPGKSSGLRRFLWLDSLIGERLEDLFPGTRIIGWWPFRVTRNSELYIDEEETANLMKAVENELHNRRKGDAVRLEVDHNCPEEVQRALLKYLRLGEDDLYPVNGPLSPRKLMLLYEGDHSPELRDPPFIAPVAHALQGQTDLFAAIRERDILLHHPYENFSSVVEFMEKAADCPDVLAIKQTLYRTGGDPRIIGALEKAVRQGKQVTAVVELRARFDEANNIQWARQLEEAGVHVVYGLVGYKIHAKSLLVVRREGQQIRRYVHLATGNYNPTTARAYSDLGLLTCRPDICEDVTNIFNLLTGICQFQGMKKLIVAPFELHDKILELIRNETENARKGLPAKIVARMNSLADEKVIDALYAASKAGVQIDLIVRGICCLRPGIKGLSENIRVRSIVDRFLEHCRIFYFENACQPKVFLGSADWLPRNFFRRIEVVFPIEDGILRDRIIREILAVALKDNVKARLMQPNGSYVLSKPARGEKVLRSQVEFMRLSTEKPAGKASSGKRYPKVKLRDAASVASELSTRRF